MEVSIIVPTYNERENITELVKRIDPSLEPLNNVEYEVIIVDDNSPDGTYKKAKELSRNYPVNPIKRTTEKGLATAVLRGVEESNSEIIAVLDADLQHPPEKLPALVDAIRKDGKDIAIGSRFVEGGSPGDFGFIRKIISKGANFIARTLFRKARHIRDIQSGFFVFKKEIIESANLNPVGYKILLEILVRAKYDSVDEVGYEFAEREKGKSKLGFSTIIDYLYHLWRLSWKEKEISRFLQFCVVGGVGTVVNLVVLYLLTAVGLFYLLSGAIAIELSLISNFFLNKIWTFRDRDISGFRSTMRALYRDHMVRFGGVVIKLATLWILTDLFGVYYLISQLVGIGIAMFWNFGGNKLWTWEP